MIENFNLKGKFNVNFTLISKWNGVGHQKGPFKRGKVYFQNTILVISKLNSLNFGDFKFAKFW